jgi:plasmid maintenance system antidote protein VapI
MPRRVTTEIMLALSPTEAARALGIRAERINEAVRDRKLIVRRIGIRHKIAVFGAGGLQEWFSSLPIVEPKPKRKVSHG